MWRSPVTLVLIIESNSFNKKNVIDMDPSCFIPWPPISLCERTFAKLPWIQFQSTPGPVSSDSDLLAPVWSRPLSSCQAGAWPRTSKAGQRVPQKSPRRWPYPNSPPREVPHGKASSSSSPPRQFPHKVTLGTVPGHLRYSSLLSNSLC